jgi:hypothetical protein
MECKYFKCEFWEEHFPCFSCLNTPDRLLKDDEPEEIIFGKMIGKKEDMIGVIVYFPNTDDLSYEELKKKSLDLIKEFRLHSSKNYVRIRSVDRRYQWCPEKKITFYRKKKKISKSKTSEG